ncbi:MAG TPA: NAD(P)H-dependent oxidoreductase [Candidatus Gracilibacteria bacterium]|nr:NAD(P)H-dependent oxidoreductase [Candidatus Gracilibacteria bacterium]
MKTLFISYLPRGEQSFTRKLVNYWQSQIPNDFLIQNWDLIKNPPPFFQKAEILAYESPLYPHPDLQEFYQISNYIKENPILVISFPIYNFSMPGIIKTFLDTICLQGETWAIQNGKYQGLLNQHRVAILTSCGGKEPLPQENYNKLILEKIFHFLGVEDIRFFNLAETSSRDIFTNFQKTQSEILKTIQDWY